MALSTQLMSRCFPFCEHFSAIIQKWKPNDCHYWSPVFFGIFKMEARQSLRSWLNVRCGFISHRIGICQSRVTIRCVKKMEALRRTGYTVVIIWEKLRFSSFFFIFQNKWKFLFFLEKHFYFIFWKSSQIEI